MQQIKLGLSMRGLGYHPSAWRDPDVPADGSMDVKYAIRVAQTAERGLFDFVFLADHSAIVEHDLPKGVFGRHHADIAEFEPLTLLAALSQATSKIGLVATASTTLHQPYQLARQFLSIDHLSGGRAGWNVVTSSRDAEAQNFGENRILEKHLRYERAKEAIDVVFGLWESWEEDAFPRDRNTGIFFDPAKMHRINHVGKHFRVRGPMTLPRSPQGRPIIAQAGASADGADFAASVADIIYALQTRFEDAQINYRTSKERIAKLGRNPDYVKILPGLLPIVARTTEEAQAKYKRLLSYLDPLVGLERLTRWFGDLSGHDLDGPLPDLRPDVRPVSRADLNLRLAREHNWTIRQLYESTVISHGHHVTIGSPADIADDMERWIKEEAADGFNIVPAVLPSGIDDFVEHVIPELQRRKLFRTEYEASTLRENLGLPPVSPRFSGTRQ
jgi:FMN-dependent oxidoreductase (nitrilotriacetate monooxygenase family)